LIGSVFGGHERLITWAEGFPAGDHVLLLGSASVLCSSPVMLNLPKMIEPVIAKPLIPEVSKSNPTLASVTNGESRVVPSS